MLAGRSRPASDAAIANRSAGGPAQTWHAGIHPGCAYPRAARENFERWVTGPFANPRAFHFHCGGLDFPGEINWHIMDATIEVDGVKLWDAGRLYPDWIAGGAALLERHPSLAEVFANPRREIGLS